MGDCVACNVSRNNCSVRYFVTTVRKVASVVTNHNNFSVTENVFLSSPSPSPSLFLSITLYTQAPSLPGLDSASTSQLLGFQAHSNDCLLKDTGFPYFFQMKQIGRQENQSPEAICHLYAVLLILTGEWQRAVS